VVRPPILKLLPAVVKVSGLRPRSAGWVAAVCAAVCWNRSS